MTVDLHIHTTASDGSDTPREIVQQALRVGLKAIAITDHDTLAGIPEARQEAADFSLEVLSGVEVNTYFNGQEIHILGYFIEPTNEEFTNKLKEFQLDRQKRIQKMLAKLKELSVNLSLERIYELSQGGSMGRPHVAQALIEAGYVNTREQAFETYIGNGKPAFVPREKLSPEEAISLINRAGGVAVLAHPGLAQIDTILPKLTAAGLKGIEVWHSKHSNLMVEHYKKLARRFNLISTGGSDYHGFQHGSCNRLGLTGAPDQTVRLLKDAAKL